MAMNSNFTLEEQLKCPLCQGTCTDPKQLECHHIFCQQCLVPLVDQDQQGQLGLSCPDCHHYTPIPDKGVAGLQPALCIKHFLEIQDSLKTLADTVEKSVGNAIMDTENSTDTPSSSAFPHCLKHVKEELRLLCDSCGELVCLQCIMKGNKHHDHECILLDEAFANHKNKIAASLEPMEMQVTVMKKALALLDTRCEEISDQQSATEDSIHTSFEEHRAVLNASETELISRLDKFTKGKLKNLAAQKEQIETTLAQLRSCQLLLKDSLKVDSEEYLKTNTVEQVKALTKLFQPHLLKPCTEADIVYTAAEVSMPMYGNVFVPYIDPSKCYVTGNRDAIVGELSTTTLHVVNSEGDPYKGPIKLPECEFVSELTGTRVSCSVETRIENQYKISYTPAIKGRHQLHIKVNGEHVQESPFIVAVTSPTLKLDNLMWIIDGLKKPWGVAVTQSGEIVVSDIERHCLSVFGPDGKKLRSFGIYGFGEPGEFNEPRGLTMDGDGNILVADCKNHRIQKLTVEGHFLKAVGNHGSGNLQFSFPSRIEYNSINKKIYVGDGNCRIQILNSDLTFCSTFGGPGIGIGLFHSDYILGGIACDSIGNVYVTDLGNTRLQVFTPEGEFLRMFGKCDHGEGELHCPVGVAIDSNNFVYIVISQQFKHLPANESSDKYSSNENHNQCVHVFTSEGQFLASKCGFNRSHGLTVDSCGLVYVCDTGNKCVKVL